MTLNKYWDFVSQDLPISMALTARAYRRAATCLSRPLYNTATTTRSFVSKTRPIYSQLHPLNPPIRPVRPRTHLLKSYQRPASTSAVAPNSKAYLESGVIAGGQDLVDVSKVLVIGSGGLSIGQAGEFDYSGA